MAAWRRVLSIGMGLCACTEPNPFAGDTGSQTDPESTAPSDPTSGDSTPNDTGTASDGAGPSTSSDPLTGTSGEAACELGTHVCIAAAPAGWSGPVALIDDAPEDPEPVCTAAFPTLQVSAFDEIVAPEADCTCDCDGPSAAQCPLTLVADNSAGCGSPFDTWGVGMNCDPSVGGPAGTYWKATTGALQGQCTPEFTEEIVDAEFGRRHTLCAPDDASMGACPDGDVCTPIPIAPFTADALCIWAEGDLECPADLGYDARRMLYRGIADERGCSLCSCDLAGECTGSVYLFSSDDCNDLTVVGTVVLDGACVNVSSAVDSSERSQSYDVDAACEPAGGAPAGAATGSDPVTLCCRR